MVEEIYWPLEAHEKEAEWKAIAFVRKRKGWSDINPNWLPTTT